MKTKSDEVYQFLIYYFIFAFFQRMLAVYVSYNLDSIHEDISNASPVIQYLFRIRQTLSFVNVFFITYIFYNFKLNNYIFVLLFLLFIKSLEFIIIGTGWIFYFIEENEDNKYVTDFIDNQLGFYLNIFTYFYILYLLLKLYSFI
jgi:hypothetical protein